MKTRLRSSLRRSLDMIGTSRHSALPAMRARVDVVTRPFLVRAIAVALGSTLIGTAVALLVQADLGLPPYDVLSSGIQKRTGLSLGQAGWIVAGALFVVAASLGRRPSLWGIAYILANGVAVDATSHMLNPPEGTIGQVGYLFAAIVTMAIGINVVLYSGTTGGPFELLMTAGEDRGIRRLRVRYVLDVGVLVGGLAIGGSFGLGTIVYAGLMGIVLQAISVAFADYDTGRQVRLATDLTTEVDLGGASDT